ncbi:related to GDSL lipase/acylhydrolase family protein [Rhynchosporium agropyri]|uniref:Related to GDSL lipase/acylhydrolase family protein n=1 Tax=Rhynchosporium agropyri TaxID=914238 RepID=A0A1E1KGU5_9HELO|nr:related to GDSL lipase/acylhydrolase family protein [Rhynchosporium agropyri]
MQLLAFSLLAASVVVSAAPGHSKRGGVPNSRSWIPHFDNLVTFGDSYTDENRLSYFFKNNGTAPPPGLLLPPSSSTAGGGITWARWVSNNTGAKLYNYASAGAVCDNKIVYRFLAPINGPPPDVVYEVDAFITDSKFIDGTTKVPFFPAPHDDNTVYNMWIGTNDLGVDALFRDSGLNGATILDYVNCIFKRFDEIYANGGRYFVLMNVAPLELSPLYGLPEKGGMKMSPLAWPDKPTNTTEISYKMKEYTSLVNSIFRFRTPFEVQVAKRYPGASFAVFDVHSLLTEIYHNPTEYLSSPANVEGMYATCVPVSGPAIVDCIKSSLSLDHFFWYDELHPSERVDQFIAKEFEKVVAGSSDYATYW